MPIARKTAVKSVEPRPTGGYLLTGETGTGKLRTARLLTADTAQVGKAGKVLGQFGTSYGVQEPGTVVSLMMPIGWGVSQETLTAVAPGDRPITLTRGVSGDGRPTLTVTAGPDRQRFVLSR